MNINHCNARRQNGAALVVGLVVLLMLTLLGISSMNMTSLELRIAGNTQNTNLVFQAADSFNERIFYTNTGTGSYRFDFTDHSKQTFSQTKDGITATTEGIYEGQTTPILCAGNSLGNVSCNAFRLTTTATQTATKASATVVQGFVRIGVGQ